jgi:hypothetical protein
MTSSVSKQMLRLVQDPKLLLHASYPALPVYIPRNKPAIYGSRALVDLGRFFSFLIYTHIL